MTFSEGVLAAIRGASIEELLGKEGGGASYHSAPKDQPMSGPAPRKTGKRGRLARRSDEDIQAMVEQIVACVAKHPDGIRSEDIRAALKIDKKELPKPITAALASGQLRKEGEKRATVYLVGKKSGGSAKAAPKRVGGKKHAKKTPAVKAKAAPKRSAAKKPAKKKPTVKAKAAPKAKAAAPKKAKTKKPAADKTANGAAAPAAATTGAEA